MPTTTNYGWTTPADTDLVKDGASAIRTLGTAIDTTTFNNANAAIAKTIVDAKGDLIVGSAADTVARLAVGGTNGHVLQVNSGATYGIEWAAAPAGGLDLLSTTTMSGSTLTISSISGDYDQLFITITDAYMSTAGGNYLRLRFNSDTGSNYDWGNTITTTSVAGEVYAAQTYYNIAQQGTSTTAGEKLTATILLPNYTSTGAKIIESQAVNKVSAMTQFIATGGYRGGSAISSATFLLSSGTMTDGTIKIYGVK